MIPRNIVQLMWNLSFSLHRCSKFHFESIHARWFKKRSRLGMTYTVGFVLIWIAALPHDVRNQLWPHHVHEVHMSSDLAALEFWEDLVRHKLILACKLLSSCMLFWLASQAPTIIVPTMPLMMATAYAYKFNIIIQLHQCNFVTGCMHWDCNSWYNTVQVSCVCLLW